MTDTRFTMLELAECCLREASLRQRVYARWIAQNRITRTKADREIALMVDAAAHFRELADAETQKSAPPGAKPDGASMFTCPDCGMTSHNPNDMLNRYCGACHKFF